MTKRKNNRISDGTSIEEGIIHIGGERLKVDYLLPNNISITMFLLCENIKKWNPSSEVDFVNHPKSYPNDEPQRRCPDYYSFTFPRIFF